MEHKVIRDVGANPRDLRRIGRLLDQGYSLNPPEDNQDDPPLYRAIYEIQIPSARMRAARALLSYGADVGPYPSGSGPLFAAVIQKDSELIELLIGLGADPNKHHDTGEPIYDWAESYYRIDEYGIDMELPEEPTADDNTTEDKWLAFLERLAIKYNKRRPDHLFALRRNGAKSYSEIHPRRCN